MSNASVFPASYSAIARGSFEVRPVFASAANGGQVFAVRFESDDGRTVAVVAEFSARTLAETVAEKLNDVFGDAGINGEQFLTEYAPQFPYSHATALRPFTESDWYGFAGASRLPDGTGPFIRVYPTGVAIVSGDDPTGAGATFVELNRNDEDGGATSIIRAFSSPEEAIRTVYELGPEGFAALLRNPTADWDLPGGPLTPSLER